MNQNQNIQTLRKWFIHVSVLSNAADLNQVRKSFFEGFFKSMCNFNSIHLFIIQPTVLACHKCTNNPLAFCFLLRIKDDEGPIKLLKK